MKVKLLILLFSTMLIACTTVQKPLTFRDVEKEFKFAKPLNEVSQAVILKQFGTVQNYRDSIFARKQRGNNGFILSAHPENGKTVVTVVKMNNEKLNSKISK